MIVLIIIVILGIAFIILNQYLINRRLANVPAPQIIIKKQIKKRSSTSNFDFKLSTHLDDAFLTYSDLGHLLCENLTKPQSIQKLFEFETRRGPGKMESLWIKHYDMTKKLIDDTIALPPTTENDEIFDIMINDWKYYICVDEIIHTAGPSTPPVGFSHIFTDMKRAYEDFWRTYYHKNDIIDLPLYAKNNIIPDLKRCAKDISSRASLLKRISDHLTSIKNQLK
jgi:hypothetical protein